MKIREVLGREIRSLRRQSRKIHESSRDPNFSSGFTVPIHWNSMWDRSQSADVTVLKNPSIGELKKFINHVKVQDEQDGKSYQHDNVSYHSVRGLSVMQPNGEIDRFYWNGRHLHDHIKDALHSAGMIPNPDKDGHQHLIRHHHWEIRYRGKNKEISDDWNAEQYRSRPVIPSRNYFSGAEQTSSALVDVQNHLRAERQEILDKLAKDRLLK